MKGDLISKASNDRRQGGLAPELTRELVIAPGRGFSEFHLSLQQWDSAFHTFLHYSITPPISPLLPH